MTVKIYAKMPDGKWGVRSNLREDNMAHGEGKLSAVQLVDKANQIARTWADSYHDGVELKVVNDVNLTREQTRALARGEMPI